MLQIFGEFFFLHCFKGCIANGVMFISGGYKGPYRGHLDNLWSYKPEADTWVEHRAMNHARSYHTMASTEDNHIIVVGGVNYLTVTDTFEDVKVHVLVMFLTLTKRNIAVHELTWLLDWLVWAPLHNAEALFVIAGLRDI